MHFKWRWRSLFPGSFDTFIDDFTQWHNTVFFKYSKQQLPLKQDFEHVWIKLFQLFLFEKNRHMKYLTLLTRTMASYACLTLDLHEREASGKRALSIRNGLICIEPFTKIRENSLLWVVTQAAERSICQCVLASNFQDSRYNLQGFSFVAAFTVWFKDFEIRGKMSKHICITGKKSKIFRRSSS